MVVNKKERECATVDIAVAGDKGIVEKVKKYQELKGCLVPSRSRSLGIFVLIIKESGDEGSDGKGR